MSMLLRVVLSIFLLTTVATAQAQTALPINVQGRVTVDGLVFNGTGKFKFALVNAAGNALYWTHDGSRTAAPFQPTGSVDINVVRGLYSVLLGDTTLAGMTNPINPDIFTNNDVRLRIWFNDNTHGFQQLLPDQRLAAVGYAFVSERADQAAVLTGNVSIQQVPSILITNNATSISLTGRFSGGPFTGDGSGITGIRGSTPFQVVDAAVNNAVPNTGYLITNLNERVVLLPATDTMQVGDIVRVAGPGSWKVTQRADQSIFASHFRGGVGAKWVARETPRSWSAIASSTNGLNLVAFDAAATRLVYLSTNGGVNWEVPPVSPQKNWSVAASSADGQRLIAGTSGDFIFVSSDFGRGWSQRIGPGQKAWSGVACSHDGSNMVAVASANSPLYVSIDGGENFVQRAAAGTANWGGVAMSADGTNIFAAVASPAGSVMISTNKGTSFTSVTVGSGNVSKIACSADGQRLIVVLGNVIHTSNDRGATWIRRDAAGSRTFTGLTCSADGAIIAASSPAGISISVDAGGAWALRASAINWTAVTCSSDGVKFAATASVNNIYTSDAVLLRNTTTGAAGYLAGGETSAVELQHAGNGRFFPLSSSGQIFAY